jgi:hypothetical protein
MTQTIIFNGQTYNGLDEMPPEARQAYEQALSAFADNDRNGVPDILEPGSVNQVAADIFADADRNGTPDLFEGQSGGLVVQTNAIVYNGQVYQRVEDLPPEARQKYEAAASKLSASRAEVPGWLSEEGAKRDNIPDWLAKLTPTGDAAGPARSTEQHSPTIAPLTGSAIQPEAPNRWLAPAILLILVMGMIILGLLALLLTR